MLRTLYLLGFTKRIDYKIVGTYLEQINENHYETKHIKKNIILRKGDN